MNILPKKKFHVRSKDNIARVRRDEAQAREEAEEVQRRVALAEQEARMDVLRRRATQSQARATSAEGTTAAAPLDRGASAAAAAATAVAAADPPDHVNLFAQVEADGVGKSTGLKNREHEAEKKAEQEKLEKNIGILTYLGQSSAELVGKAWYDQSADERRKADDVRARKSERFKRAADPLHRMNDYLRKTEDVRRHRDPDGAAAKRHAHKTHQHHHHRKSHTAAASSASLSGPAKIQQLRQERLRREQQERHRAQQVLAKARGEKPAAAAAAAGAASVPVGRYTNQFNPHLARQNWPQN